ncbi:PIN domain-containing protein [Pedobacter sp. AK017]|uniref:PIN domain-containing protein n=1 Tax=Pedobacter sp. AK017 TaxID=2723073 RepID=UPI001616652B|nr:PIN domain-containing protein [Pedobacter sp. AK017]
MNGINYVVDTNCFIYLLSKNPTLLPFLDSKWAYSYMTEIELLCQKTLDKEQEFLIRSMLNTCFKVNHSQAITELTIQLRREHNVKIPDAIVAATAQLLQLPLITADKGFAKIKGIDCILLEL